jgi:hypothetical protein
MKSVWPAADKSDVLNRYEELLRVYKGKDIRSVFTTSGGTEKISLSPSMTPQSIDSFVNRPFNVKRSKGNNKLNVNIFQTSGKVHVDPILIKEAVQNKAYYYCVAHKQHTHAGIIIKTADRMYTVGLGYNFGLACIYSPDYVLYSLKDTVMFDCGIFHAKHILKLMQFNQMIVVATLHAHLHEDELNFVRRTYILNPKKYKYTKMQSSTFTGLKIREKLARIMLGALPQQIHEKIHENMGITESMIADFKTPIKDIEYHNCVSFVINITSKRNCVDYVGFFHPHWCTQATGCTGEGYELEGEDEIIKQILKQVDGTDLSTDELLPSGWYSAIDPTNGRTYYYNKKGVVTWQLPIRP